MITRLYHESFEYQEQYNAEKLGTTGIQVQATKIVCPTCNGTGSHFRADLDENLMVQSIQEDADEDSWQAYRGGAFDQVCTECSGRNVVDDVAWETVPSWAKDCIDEWEQEKAFDEQIRFAENGYRY